MLTNAIFDRKVGLAFAQTSNKSKRKIKCKKDTPTSRSRRKVY